MDVDTVTAVRNSLPGMSLILADSYQKLFMCFCSFWEGPLKIRLMLGRLFAKAVTLLSSFHCFLLSHVSPEVQVHSVTSVQAETTQRQLTWPSRRDDTHTSRSDSKTSSARSAISVQRICMTQILHAGSLCTHLDWKESCKSKMSLPRQPRYHQRMHAAIR